MRRFLHPGAALLSALLAPEIAAQTACGQPGVDLVPELGPALNYGVTSGLDALAFGLQTTNLGTLAAPYEPSSAAHPVVGLGLHRFSIVGGASRIEQIGMSWARHVTLPALQTGAYCACSPAGTNALGPGCNDTNSAGSNGQAMNLGPRRQVDPFTGDLVFPFTPAPIGPAHSGRLQFDPGAVTSGNGERFVVEAHVVSAADAFDGMIHDNTVWQELVAVGAPAEPTFSTVGSAQRAATVLDAWRAFDPTVAVSDYGVWTDGLLQFAFDVTQTSPGTWHYEYALYNRNSRRAVRGLRLGIPASTLVTGIEFHDVSYHDGDGVGGVSQSGADWAAQLTPGELAWSTQTQAQDPNANALRWGTLYTFRFDCDRPPMTGHVLLDIFEPGPFDTEGLLGPVPIDPAALATPYCFGDGQGTLCPCGNHSPGGHGEGCTSSLGTGGHLRITGWPSVAHDSLSLVGTQLTNSTALYLQGTAWENSGQGTVLGDGLLCIGGTLIRLGSATSSAWSSSYPAPGQAPVSVRGAVPPGSIRTYQIWYRNAASFCTSATYNLTNGIQVIWAP